MMSKNNDENFYITQGSFRKMINSLDIKFGEITVELCQQYYENDNLRPLLGNKDIEFLFLTKILFSGSNEDFLLRNENKFINNRFIFDNTSNPKYHSNIACEAMNNNYKNFLIPPEIQFRGNEEIIKFKKFASDNKHLLRDNEQRFLNRLEVTFNLRNPPKKLEYTNSGSYEISTQTLDEIKNLIKKYVSEANELMNKDKSVYLSRYKPHSNQHTDSDGLKHWLDILRPDLMSALFSFGVKKYGSGEIKFAKSLLEMFKFEPCSICFK